MVDFDESKVKRDKDGRFAEKNARKIQELERKFLPDEMLPRSVGAKWSNEEISMPDGTIAKFVEGSKITHKEVFAGAGIKKPIRDIERLIKDYPGTKRELWQKVKGRANILWKGEEIKAEIHWYQEPSAGRKEIKFKKEI